MVKTLPSNAKSVGSIPSHEAKTLQVSGPKIQNRKRKQNSNKFNKTLKMVYIKNIFLKNCQDKAGSKMWEKIFYFMQMVNQKREGVGILIRHKVYPK